MKKIASLIIFLSSISWASDFAHNISSTSKFVIAFLDCVYNKEALIAKTPQQETLIARCLHEKKVPSSALNPLSKRPLSNESINTVITLLEVLEK